MEKLTMDETYVVIIGGLTIWKNTEKGIKPYFSTGGIRYDINKKNKKVLVGLQEVYMDHEPDIMTAMEPLKSDLLDLGKMMVLSKDPTIQANDEALAAVLDQNPTESRKRRKNRPKNKK